MNRPKPAPGVLLNLAQLALFLMVLGCLLVETLNITWGQVALRIVAILLAGYGFVKLEERSATK